MFALGLERCGASQADGEPMKQSKVSHQAQRSDRLWLPSLLLLLGQFLTIAPVIVIVLADEQQRESSDTYATVLDGLNQLSFDLAELTGPSGSVTSVPQSGYSDFLGRLSRLRSAPALPPQSRERLAEVEAAVYHMEGEKSNPAAFQNDARTARSELLKAQRAAGLQISRAGDSVTQKNTYLKALIAGACLLAFCVVLVVRRFRIQADIQRELQEELQKVNEDVIAALALARSECDSKSQILAKAGHADHSKVDSGQRKREAVEFEPGKVVADVVELFTQPADEKGIRLKCILGKGVPTTVKGDPGALHHVLMNLISNAVRFTDQGEVELRVKEVLGAKGQTSLQFEVSDTGVGMTEQARNRVFEPFVRKKGSHPEENHRTGLGLVICKKLVELMRGSIEADSEPGRGSTFRFTAVFDAVPATAKQEPSSGANGNVEARAGERRRAPASNYPGDRRQGRDRRSEPRHGINYPTLLRSEAGVAGIRILDVSASGLRVSVPFQLDLQTEVEIRIDGESVTGLVRNCTRLEANEFHAGIEIPHAHSADGESLHHLRLMDAVRALHHK